MSISTGWLQNLSLRVLDLPAGFSECCSVLRVTLSAAEASVHIAAEFLESPICKAIAHHWDIDFTSLLIGCVKPCGQNSSLCSILKITFIIFCLCFVGWHLVISLPLLLSPPTTDSSNWTVLHLIYDSSGSRIQGYQCT